MNLLSLSWYEGLLRRLRQQGRVEFITYDDFPWGLDIDHKGRYRDEWVTRKAALRSGRVDPAKAYLVLQHDTNSATVGSVTMGRVEQQTGARSSIMTFAR
jgi:hypothetical protein